VAYKDPEKKKAYMKVYCAAHAEERNACSEAWYAANREEILAKRAEQKEEKAIYDASYYAAHRERRRVYKAAHYETHKEEKAAHNKAYGKVYRADHLPESAAKSSVRRALIAGTMIGITAERRAQVKEIYRKAAEDSPVRCYLCGRLIKIGDRHVDHILPVDKDGPTRPSNLAIACSKCNLSKGNKHPNELGILV